MGWHEARYNPVVSDRPLRSSRPDTREVAELKQLKLAQPALASAVDMQIELLAVQRRVQARVPLPWIQPDPQRLAADRETGSPVARFGDIPLDWTDFRLALRQTSDILRRHEAMSHQEHQQIVALGRDGNALEPLVTDWYTRTSSAKTHGPKGVVSEGTPPIFEQVLVLSLRPFLSRCAEVLLQKADFSGWSRGHCPVCGWEPDFAVITHDGERHLVCGRCLAQWLFDQVACPYCGNSDATRITSFATRDGQYRVTGCDACHRYVKAFDARRSTRPVLIAVDSIATLPLDALAMQRGYSE